MLRTILSLASFSLGFFCCSEKQLLHSHLTPALHNKLLSAFLMHERIRQTKFPFQLTYRFISSPEACHQGEPVFHQMNSLTTERLVNSNKPCSFSTETKIKLKETRLDKLEIKGGRELYHPLPRWQGINLQNESLYPRSF